MKTSCKRKTKLKEDLLYSVFVIAFEKTENTALNLNGLLCVIKVYLINL